MNDKSEMTAPYVSVGADTEQSNQICTTDSISENYEDFKTSEQSYEELRKEFLRMADSSYLKTISMTELLDSVYQSKRPLWTVCSIGGRTCLWVRRSWVRAS